MGGKTVTGQLRRRGTTALARGCRGSPRVFALSATAAGPRAVVRPTLLSGGPGARQECRAYRFLREAPEKMWAFRPALQEFVTPRRIVA